MIEALAYVRQVNGEGTDGMRIHGVNLSVGYAFDPEWFACGRSPLCKEVDKTRPLRRRRGGRGGQLGLRRPCRAAWRAVDRSASA